MKYTALETELVTKWQNGEPDAHRQAPEITTSDGPGNPCRHCLRDIPVGAPMLILAHQPFPTPQPYAETGPVFLCATPCPRGDSAMPPEILTTSPDYLVKGYNAQDRIIYGTGSIVAASDLHDHAGELLKRPDIAYLHVRSARNNCYQLRIDR